MHNEGMHMCGRRLGAFCTLQYAQVFLRALTLGICGGGGALNGLDS